MMKRSLQQGLIICATPSDSGPFNEFVSRCGWPVLFRPELRTLAHELAILNPRRLVFWLEWADDVKRTQQLTSWVRERHPQSERIILAYEIAARFESCLRAAGAHCYWPLSNDSPDALEEALRIVLRIEPRSIPAIAHGSARSVGSLSSSSQACSEFIRPP